MGDGSCFGILCDHIVDGWYVTVCTDEMNQHITQFYWRVIQWFIIFFFHRVIFLSLSLTWEVVMLDEL